MPVSMPYIIILGTQEQIRYLSGPRLFSELLTPGELERVRSGQMIGINAYDGILGLSSELEDGARVVLREPQEQDLSVFGAPDREGNLAGLCGKGL